MVRGLCDFLELSFDDAMLRHHERAESLLARLHDPEIHQRLLLPLTQDLGGRTDMLRATSACASTWPGTCSPTSATTSPAPGHRCEHALQLVPYNMTVRTRRLRRVASRPRERGSPG